MYRFGLSLNRSVRSPMTRRLTQERYFSSAPFVYSAEVESAIKRGQPVVALESTIISHGMPWPDNLECAKQVEQVIRDNGATPATIAILDGELKIGLEDDDLVKLAQRGTAVKKCSRRDLAVVVGGGSDGATTVSGTMVCANMAGIKVFATGGIGGVHRDAFTNHTTLDVSADLTELGRTPVCVVSAGVKSILDVGRTLEFLETQGVTVYSYETENFPDFFTRDSGFKSPESSSDLAEVAAVLDANEKLGVSSGMVLAVPNPNPTDKDVIQQAIQTALAESVEQGVSGRLITPFLLKRVNELTGGTSLASNIELVKRNAQVAAQLAVEYTQLANARRSTSPKSATSNKNLPTSSSDHLLAAPIVVIGGTCVDIQAKGKVIHASSSIGKVTENFGGVARNICERIAHHCSAEDMKPPMLFSCIGNDRNGEDVQLHCDAAGIDTTLLHRCDGRTSNYIAVVNQDGSLYAAMADTKILAALTPDMVQESATQLEVAPLVVVDGNVSEDSLKEICTVCSASNTPVFFEPVSVAKAAKCVPMLDQISYIKPNEDELVKLHAVVTGAEPSTQVDEEKMIEMAEDVVRVMVESGPPEKHIIATRGGSGIVHAVATRSANGAVETDVEVIPVKQVPEDQIVNVTGAGDTFVGSLAYSLAYNRGDALSIKRLIEQASEKAQRTLTSSTAVAV